MELLTPLSLTSNNFKNNSPTSPSLPLQCCKQSMDVLHYHQQSNRHGLAQVVRKAGWLQKTYHANCSGENILGLARSYLICLISLALINGVTSQPPHDCREVVGLVLPARPRFLPLQGQSSIFIPRDQHALSSCTNCFSSWRK